MRLEGKENREDNQGNRLRIGVVLKGRGMRGIVVVEKVCRRIGKVMEGTKGVQKEMRPWKRIEAGVWRVLLPDNTSHGKSQSEICQTLPLKSYEQIYLLSCSLSGQRIN